MSIRIKIISSFLLVALIPFLTIAVLVYFDVRSTLEKNALEKVNGLASIQKNRTLETIEHYNELLASFSSRLVFRQELSRFNQTGAVASQEKISQIIPEAKEENPKIKDITILNNSGRVVSSTDKKRVGKDESGEEFFQKGKEKPDTSVLFKEEGKVYIYLSGPLILEGEKIGVVAIAYSTEDLFGLFADFTGLGETGSWGLAKKNENGDALIIVPGGRYDPSPNSPLESILTKENTGAPIIKAISGIEDAFADLVNFKGKHVIAATRYIPELGWGLGVTQERAEVFKATDALFGQTVFFTLLLSIFVAFLSSVVSQIMIKPILSLSQAASKVAAGDLEVVAKVHSKDEIGSLAAIFNQMVSKLKIAQLNLEGQVKQRTIELDKKVDELERLNKLMVGRELKMIELKKQLKQKK